MIVLSHWQKKKIRKEKNAKRLMSMLVCKYKETNDNDCQVIVCIRVYVFPRASKEEINNLSDDDDESSLLMIVGRASE
jgi:hypothetical protein